jgi:hemerythrin superfamily protein
MADDRKKPGARDRATVAANEPYEVGYFAKKHGISREDAQALIERVGNDRKKLDAAASKLSGSESRTAKPKPAPARKSSARSPLSRRAKSGGASQPVVTRRPRVSSRPSVANAVATAVAEVPAAVARSTRTAAKTTARSVSTQTGAAVEELAKTPSTARKAFGTAVESVKSAVTSRAAGLVGAAAAGVVTGLAANLARKTVVQAPSALAGDWFEALKAEHRMALTLFDALQATGDRATAKRSILLAELKHALGKHAFTEENVIYPALRAWGDKADADKLNHDHGYVKQYLYDLEAMDKDSPDFLEKVAAFRADLEAHIHEEESAIFPPLHAGLGEAGNARVTALSNKEAFKLA